jgi:hypothetical protein
MKVVASGAGDCPMCRQSLDVPRNVPQYVQNVPQRVQNFPLITGVLHPYVESGLRMIADDTRCRSQLPDIMELTTTKMKKFEKYYPEYPFPSEETKDFPAHIQIAQTVYWKGILAKHGGPFADCLSHPETSMDLTYPRLINLFYQETEEERSLNTRLWAHWCYLARYNIGRTREGQYQPGYKKRKGASNSTYPWYRLISDRKRKIDQKMRTEDLHFVVHTV